jgi:hypothetical protein
MQCNAYLSESNVKAACVYDSAAKFPPTFGAPSCMTTSYFTPSGVTRLSCARQLCVVMSSTNVVHPRMALMGA